MCAQPNPKAVLIPCLDVTRIQNVKGWSNQRGEPLNLITPTQAGLGEVQFSQSSPH